MSQPIGADKLKGYPGTLLVDNNADPVTTPGLYVLANGDLLFVRNYGDADTNLAQTKITTTGQVSYRNKTGSMTGWAPWYYVAAPDKSIGTDMLRDKIITPAKLADGVLPENPVTAPEELAAGKVLLGGGGKTVAAGDYTVEAVVPSEGYVRFAVSGPSGVKLAAVSGYDTSKTYILSLEARYVSGGASSPELGPTGSTYNWDTMGYLDLTEGGDWQSATLTGAHIDDALGLFFYAAGVYDIRGIKLADLDGNDVLDHGAFEALGDYHPGAADTPENHLLPTLQKTQALVDQAVAPIPELAGRLEAAEAEVDTIQNILADTVTMCGVQFGGSSNKGATVKRLYAAAGATAGVGTDTQNAANDFDGMYPWCERRRCCGYFAADGNFVVNAYAGEPGYATDGSNGEVWVEHSLFYYRHTYDGDAETVLISSAPQPGFSPAPIFLKPDGTLFQKAYTAAYPLATVDGKATSRSGVFSDVCSLNTAMAAARTLGNNYTVTTTAEWYTECLYMWVEFATRNLQSVMAGAYNMPYGATDTATVAEDNANRIIVTNAVAAKYVIGQTILIGTSLGSGNKANNRVVTAIEVYDPDNKAICFDGSPVNIAVGNIVCTAAWKNGSCDSVLSSSGSPVSNTDGKHNCVYRGKETPYGNAFEWISDILFKREGAGTSEDPYTCYVYFLSAPTKYAAGAITGDYTKLHFTVSSVDGLVKKLGYDSRFPWLRIPSEVGASTTTYYSDSYYWPRETVTAARAGGVFNHGWAGGPCCWNCHNAPWYSAVDCRARLSYHRT